MAHMPRETIRFEDVELDPGSFELRRTGRLVKLERIPLQLLSCSPSIHQKPTTRPLAPRFSMPNLVRSPKLLIPLKRPTNSVLSP